MPADASTVPELRPLLVAGEEDVDALVRAARAGIAMLSLQLRSVEGDVAAAEQSAQAWDLAPARDLLDVSVDHWMETRRLEMAQELEQARTDAALLVAAARTEAADIVATASEESLAVLLAGVRLPGDTGAPSLRVVADPPMRPSVPFDPVQRDHPSARAPSADPAVVVPAEPPPPRAAAIVEPSPAVPVAEAAPVVASSAVIDFAPVSGRVPVVDPLLVDDVPLVAPATFAVPLAAAAPAPPEPATPEQVTPAVVARSGPVADAIAAAVAAALADVGLAPGPPGDPGAARAPLDTAAGPAPGPPHSSAVITMPATAATPAIVTPATEGPADRPSRLRQLLFMDVLLPMVAVLVVLIVLLAWVG